MAKRPRWIMSYAYTVQGLGNVRFGSSTLETEHPIDTILRWNRDYSERHHVLLWYHEIGPDEGLLADETDGEIGAI